MTRINFQNMQATHETQYQIKQTTQSKKWAEDLNRHFSKYVQRCRWLRNTGKDARHHSFLEKHKSKLQWGVTSHPSERPSSKSTNNKCWRGCVEKATLLHSWWECKLIQPLWRTVWGWVLYSSVGYFITLTLLLGYVINSMTPPHN